MIECTLIYPDCDSASEGEFYLPGEPLPHYVAHGECALCQQIIADSHSHGGVVVDVGGMPVNSDPVHLRCLTDCADQYGAIGLTLGASEFGGAGRHAAPAPEHPDRVPA